MRIAPISNSYQNNRIRQRSDMASGVHFQASGNNYSNIVLKFLKETLSPKMFANLQIVDNPKVFSLTTASGIVKDSPKFANNFIGPLPERFFDAINVAREKLSVGQSGFHKSYKIEKYAQKAQDGSDKEFIRVSRPYVPNGRTRINIACNLETGANDKMEFLIGDFD